MKKIIALMLALVMVLSFAGCGEVGKAESTVKNFFDACKEGNLEEAKGYILLDDGGETTDDDKELYDMAALMLEKLNYSIVSSEKIDAENVVVTVSVTAPDMKVAVGEFFQDALAFAFANAFSDTPLSDEETEAEMKNMFVKAVGKEDLGTVTNEAVVTVVKVDGTWLIDAYEAFADVLTGGMVTAFEEVSNSFSGE